MMMLSSELATQLTIVFFGALLGALFGGVARWTGARNDRRLRLTLELYNEFHSPAFNHIRIVAHAALERLGAVPTAYEATEGEERDAISSIVHFWEKVAQLAHIGALDKRLLRRFFGQYARWWSELLCRTGGLNDAEWGTTLRNIQALFERLKTAHPPGARR